MGTEPVRSAESHGRSCRGQAEGADRERSFERGLSYVDVVSWGEVGDCWVRASARGTERYEVELRLGG